MVTFVNAIFCAFQPPQERQVKNIRRQQQQPLPTPIDNECTVILSSHCTAARVLYTL